MRSIWAVATNTLRQAVRMKIAVVFIVLLIIILPVMGFTVTGDGTVKGRLQTFVSYGLSLTSLLLCLLTIIVSIYSLSSDLEQKQIYTVLTKPIRRAQFIMGKLLGVILLDMGLLVFFSAIIYVITIYMPQFTNATESDRTQVRNEFFTARASLTPVEADVTRQVDSLFEKLRKGGQLPAEVINSKIAQQSYKNELARRVKLSNRAAVPGQELLWEFHNVKPMDPNESLFIRFKYDVSENPPDLQVYSAWQVGDYRQIKYGGDFETPIYAVDRKDLIRTFHEIEIPADAVAEDGYLAVRFLNVPQLNNTVVIFPPEDGLEVLYKADTFSANFIKAVLLVLFRLVFLACLGILASTFLSFSVAILFCLAIFFTGTISGFFLESFETLSEGLSEIYQYIFKPIIQLLPRFDKFNPTKFLVPARLLSWSLLARVAGTMICIKALILLLFALLIFSYREIAKIVA